MADRILVLDDEKDYAQLLMHLLHHQRFIADTATHPDEALRMLRLKPYQLIVSDFIMPEMNGAEFLQKARLVVPDIPFIIISGLMNTPDLLNVANLGVVEVMPKPLDSKAFLQLISQYVKPVPEDDPVQDNIEADDASGDNDWGVIRYPDNTQSINYPRDWIAFEAKSPTIRCFLQNLWEYSKQTNLLFLETPAGVELEDVAQQLAHWQSGDSSQGIVVDARNWLLKITEDQRPCPKSKNVCVVQELQALSLQELDQLASWTKKQTGQHEPLTTVICYPPEWPERHHSAGFNLRALAMRAEAEAVRMPALHERLADLVTIARRSLRSQALDQQKLEAVEMTPSVLAVVLAYRWPGNHKELKQAMGECIREVDEGPVTAALLQNALGIWDGQSHEAPEIPTLEAFMLKCQRNYLEAVSPHVGGYLPAALASAGISPAKAPTGSTLERLPFLFPELLREPAKPQRERESISPFWPKGGTPARY